MQEGGISMQIKEVEILTGMTRANIRFYEKQGLLNRTIRNEYNYREYTKEDVRQLQRIKLLRQLEVSMEDIKAAKDDVPKMEQMILDRLSNLNNSVKKIVYKK